MESNHKILSLETIVDNVKALRMSGKKVVFTNGCFDVLHAGHVRYLTASRAAGDVLVLGLNSDLSVKKIKDPGRPINPQDHRAEVLAGLTVVDYIVFFDEMDPLRLIQALQPDVLVKGADWAETDIIGAAEVKSRGGRVVRVALAPGISTTGIIDKIVKTYGA